MCTSDESRHEARTDGESRHFQCVLDTLLLPFVVDGEVKARSRSPVSEAVVEIEASQQDVRVDPDDAVMSLGVAVDAAPPQDVSDALPEYGYGALCPYVNAFPDRAEYDRWAESADDAVTMALPLTEGFALADGLLQRLDGRVDGE